MSVDAFLFLQPSDIAHFQATQHRYHGLKRLFIDPGLVEAAVTAGVDLHPFEFRALDVGRHLQSRVFTEASTHAAMLDQRLTRERQALFGDGVLQGWDQSLLRQFFVRALLFKYLGEICERTFPEAQVGVFRPDNPQLFYYDACIATDMFCGASTRWQVVDRYPAGKHWQSGTFAHCFDFDAIRERVLQGRADAITHIPTTYRHLDVYERQITAAFAANVDLPSPFWDLPIRRDAVLAQPIAKAAAQDAPEVCGVYRERARAIFEQHLGALLPVRAGLQAQAELFAQRCHMQAVNYHGLRRALAGSRPHFVVTDHDTGNNGPLFSVAAELDARVTVLPHSSYATGAIPHGRRVEVVERDGFMTPMRTVLGERIRTRGVRLTAMPMRRPRERAKTVCMLLNGMISNGLFHIDFAGMVAFYKALDALCEQRGAKLVLRLKPTASGVNMIAGALGVPVQALEAVLKPSIEEVAAEADLCVSFGQPTTGSISFLASGCYLLHASRTLWPTDYASSPAYFADGTVDCLYADEALADIDAMLADDERFALRARRQFDDFERRLSRGSGFLFDPEEA